MQIDTILFTHPFETRENRKKFLIGTLLTTASFLFLPLLPLIIGYGARLFRRAMDNCFDLPEWDDWGEMFMDGLRTWGAALVYSAPLVLFILCLSSVWFIFPLLMIFLEESGVSEEIGATLAMGIMIPSMLIMLITIPLSLVTVFPAMVGWARAAHQRSFQAGIQVREVLAILRSNPGDFILAMIILYGAMMLLGMVFNVLAMTIVCLCLMPVILPAITFYGQLLQAALLGVAYRETLAKTAPMDPTLEEE